MKRITIDNRQFSYLGVEPHTRVDGRETNLHTWMAECMHPGCNACWIFKTPAMNVKGEMEPPEAVSRQQNYRFKRRFCMRHTEKRKRDRVSYAKQSKVTDADVRVMREIAKAHKGHRTDLYQRLSVLFGVTPSTTREILAGRRRATAT
jgi:hypothetical protein